MFGAHLFLLLCRNILFITRSKVWLLGEILPPVVLIFMQYYSTKNVKDINVSHFNKYLTHIELSPFFVSGNVTDVPKLATHFKPRSKYSKALLLHYQHIDNYTLQLFNDLFYKLRKLYGETVYVKIIEEHDQLYKMIHVYGNAIEIDGHQIFLDQVVGVDIHKLRKNFIDFNFVVQTNPSDRWNTDKYWFDPYLYYTKTNLISFKPYEPPYLFRGLLSYQIAIFKILSSEDGKVDDTVFQFKAFPYYSSIATPKQYMFDTFPFLWNMALLFTLTHTVGGIVSEKELKIKSYLRIIGVTNLSYYGSFFITNYIKLSILFAFFVYPIYISITHTNTYLFILIVSLYIASICSFVLFISTFFKSSINSMKLFFCIWIILSFETYIISNDHYSTFEYIIRCLNINNPFKFAISNIAWIELIGIELNFSNMFVDPNNLFPIGGCLLMMLFNTIFLWQLTFIISALFPKDGSPSMTMYEFLFGKKINKQPFAFFDYQDSGMNVFVSKEQATGDVRLRHCTKIYSTTGERALDSLTFTARHGEITTLIGHNGAGKSTTFGVLSGMTSLSSGRIYVGKDNLIKNFDKYRSLIGYCPQHDAFFPHLTVFEQIYLIILLKKKIYGNIFWTKFKFFRNKIVNDEINSYLERLNLEDVKDKKPFILPKGTSRKVSLAMALGGNSKILLLDEPRTSMDIDSNMEINVLLKDIKKEKTIILATHILDDEAYISDKMIFLSKGRVAASGTWKELMKRFAPGYILNIQYKNNSIDNIKETVKIIQYMMPIATINSTSKVNEASFLLPTKENIECVELIQTLENKAKDLQICDYQLLKTTFKDAYLKMDHMADMSNESMNLACNAKKFANEICGEKKKKIKRNLYLFYRQVAALLRKHRIYFDNHWLQFLLQSALPISILVFKLYFASDTTLTKFYQGVKFDSNYMAPFILPYYIKNSSSLYHLNDEVLVKRNIDNIKSIIQTQYNSSKRITIIENHGTDNKALTEKYLKYFLSKEQLGYGFELQNPLDTSDVVIRFNNIAIHSIMISMVEYFKIFKDLHIEASIKVLSPPGINGSVLTMNDKSYMEKNYETMPWLLDFETDGAFVFMSLVLYGILHTSHSIIFLIEERISHFKHQQLSANISKKCFYLCNLLFNLMTFSGGLIIIMFTLVTGFKSLLSWHSVICFSIIMIGYYISNAPFIWMMSGMFHTPLKGYIFMIVFQFLFPCFFFILSFVVIMFFHSVLPMQGLTLIGFFSPSGCLIFHLTEIAGYMTYNDFNYYEQTFGVLFVVQILRGICTYMLFWIIEDDYIQFYYHRKIKKYLKSMKTLLELLNFKDKSLTISDESTDLINTNDEIVAVNLGKKYKKCYLLKNVTFNVGKNECFCFIGSNGAGKTLIFDILTKRTYATEGSYYIKGIQLNRNQARIGYCQQKDSFMPEYTIEDLMIIFATLLGYVNVDEIVNEIVECFGLEKHRYKYFKNLSGGQKKRLSMSIAILAGEDILLLDEPTSSVDPKSRRFIWDFLEALKGLNRTILISTHNITECEYLANKIGFFKKDSSFDVGTIDFVKHLFSNRYIVSITLENPTMDNWIEVQNKMIEIFECLPINLRSIRRTNEWKVSANNEIRTWLDIYNTVVKIVEYFNSMDENNNNENTDDEGNDEDEKNIEVTRPIITTFDVSNCSFDKALYEYIVKNDALSV